MSACKFLPNGSDKLAPVPTRLRCSGLRPQAYGE